MAEEIIQVTINKDGTVEIKVVGVKGMTCTQLTHDIEQALGGEIIERELSSEAYESVEQINENKVWS